MEFFLLWVICGIITAVVAKNKGRDGCGWSILGFSLGPFGIVLALVVARDQAGIDAAALAKGDTKKCPECAELIRAEALKCRYCGASTPVYKYAPKPWWSR